MLSLPIQEYDMPFQVLELSFQKKHGFLFVALHTVYS